MIRDPVVTRKNARGSHNGDSARLAAVIWTVTTTAQMAGLNVLTYLTAYLNECGRTGGKPLTGPDLERFPPWTASPGDLQTWAQPPSSQAEPVPGNHHGAAHVKAHADYRYARPQDFRILTNKAASGNAKHTPLKFTQTPKVPGAGLSPGLLSGS